MESKSPGKGKTKDKKPTSTTKESTGVSKETEHELDVIIEKGLFASSPHHYIKNNPKER